MRKGMTLREVVSLYPIIEQVVHLQKPCAKCCNDHYALGQLQLDAPDEMRCHSPESQFNHNCNNLNSQPPDKLSLPRQVMISMYMAEDSPCFGIRQVCSMVGQCRLGCK